MHFLQALQSPVIAQIGNVKVSIPKLTLDDAIVWSELVKCERIERDTAEMEPHRKREFLAFYPPIAPDAEELRRLLRTPAGVKFVLEKQWPKAAVVSSNGDGNAPIPPITHILATNGTGPLTTLAVDISDLQYSNPAPTAATEQGSTDPLTKSAQPG